MVYIDPETRAYTLTPSSTSLNVDNPTLATYIIDSLTRTRSSITKKTPTGEVVPFNYFTLEESLENNRLKDFIVEAVNDGWVAIPTPGYYDTPYRIQLLKLHSQNWVYQLTLHTQNGVKKQYWDVYFHALQLDDTGKSNHFELSFSYDEKELKTYTNTFTERTHHCPECGRKVGLENLNRVAFANPSCKDCYEVLKRKLERPGWDN